MKMPLRHLSCAIALISCVTWAKADPVVQDVADKFVASLPANWHVDVGSWVYFDTVTCFERSDYSCYGANPASPYGSPYFGEFGSNPNLATLQLNSDEAVVVILRTPPEMRYYSFVQYLYKRPDSTTEIFGSLSRALNHRQLGTSGSRTPGLSPFDSYAAVVWAADRDTWSSVRANLIAAGLPAQSVNFLPLPRTIPETSGVPAYDVPMGRGSSAAVFNMLMRTALPVSQASFDSYRAESPYAVLRVGPNDHAAPNPAPVAGYTSDVSGVVEGSALKSALSKLVADIKTKYGASYTLRSQRVSFTTRPGWVCILTFEECTGDNYDSLYSNDTPTIVRVKNLDDMVIVAGVNHQKTGKATYLNHTVYDTLQLAAISSVTDADLPSQSALYHAGVTSPIDPRINQYKNLYAYVFAYDCAGKSFCRQIPAPSEGNPVGLPPGAPFFVLGRDYLEPRTLVRPAVSEVVPHQVFVATRR